MKKLPIEKKDWKTSVEYFKMQSNVPLHVTVAGGGKSIVLLPAGRLVTKSMNTITTVILIKISV